jgi:hypothetical protein
MFELSSLAAQCGLIVTGILWGTTNVALETNTENDSKIHNSKSTKEFFLNLIKNFKFLMFYGLNQLGSILFYFFLTFTNLAIGSLIANGVTFFTSYLCEIYIGTKKVSVDGMIGIFLVLVGLYFCIACRDDDAGKSG